MKGVNKHSVPGEQPNKRVHTLIADRAIRPGYKTG